MTTTRQRPEQVEFLTAARSMRRRNLFARGAAHEAIRAETVDGVTRLRLSGPIGEGGTTAAQFINALPDKGDVVLRIFSPGGSVFDGIEIFNALARHPGNVRIEIGSLAASAASIVCMAADVLAVAPGAHVMVHNAWSVCVGPAQDMRQEALVLESVDKALCRIYATRSGLSASEIARMLNAETWMLGQQAIDMGFADELLGAADPVRNHFDLSVYQNVPAALATIPPLPRVNIESRADLERELRRIGLANRAAKKVAAAGFAALSGDQESAASVELAARVAAATAELNF